MQQQRIEVAKKLEKVHSNLFILKKDDKEFLIQVGAALEKIVKEMKSDDAELTRVLHLCLEGLKAIYEKQIVEFDVVVNSIKNAIDVTRHALISDNNAEIELSTKKAWQDLWDTLYLNKSDHPMNMDSAEQTVSGPEPGIAETPEASSPEEPVSVQSQEIPMERATTLLEQPPSDESDSFESVNSNGAAEEEFDEAELAELTLNDAAATLVQIETSDKRGLKKVSEIIKRIIKRENYDDEIVDKMLDAISTLNELINGQPENPNILYGEASRHIETALELIESKELSPNENTNESAIDKKPEIKQSTPPPITPKASTGESQVTLAPPKATGTVVPVITSVFEPLPADADSSLIGEFITESREYIENSEAALLAMETNPDDDESVNIVFRAFHTIKGTSAFLGLAGISEFAHRAESFYSRIRDGEIKCIGGYADLSLQAVDMVKELIDNVERALSGAPLLKPANYDQLITILESPEQHGISNESNAQLDELASTETSSSSSTQDDAASRTLDLSAQTTNLRSQSNQQTQQSQQSLSKPTTESSVRVSTGRLDQLIDMVGELVIAQSMVAQDNIVSRNEHHELLKKVMHASKIVRELQDLTMLMRMVPLKPTFQKMARVVRDVARKSKKHVDFVSEGEDVEIDRNMVDLMNDPLVHMLRNSVDHGIEAPADRESIGKNRKGTVKLNAYHSGGSVVLEINDDGHGLDRERIVEKAITRGLIDSDNNMTDNDVYSLIFEPGFSTAKKVTDVSGRGVGLDVVKKGVERLRGRIEINSRPGEGTTFLLRLPLTLAITDGMLVKVGGQRYIVPTINIYMSFRPVLNNLSTIAGKGEMVMLRDTLMPLFRLHRLFNIDDAIEDPTQGLLVVVDDGERQCALLVDELLGQQQVVAKSLGSGIGKVQGISGGAILGDGRVGLILDTTEILTLARQSSDSVSLQNS
ncbi:chemotaxis protein CheA [candidate division KSB1 bacterium]|nr:chemotaxis protein CheA [candidate division KSB1 bacterium]